jgi:hypothetical protein
LEQVPRVDMDTRNARGRMAALSPVGSLSRLPVRPLQLAASSFYTNVNVGDWPIALGEAQANGSFEGFCGSNRRALETSKMTLSAMHRRHDLWLATLKWVSEGNRNEE